MSVTVVVEMTLKPQFADTYANRLKTTLPETQRATGCQGLVAHRDREQPNRFIVVEQWDSADHYKAYFESRKQSGSLGTLGEMSEHPPIIRYFDVIVSTAPA